MDPGMDGPVALEGLSTAEFAAGPDHLIVVYRPADTGAELDPDWIFRGIAADADRRAASGLRILSMTTMPLRHGGTFMGQEGSGFQTKAAIAVVYERWGRAAD